MDNELIIRQLIRESLRTLRKMESVRRNKSERIKFSGGRKLLYDKPAESPKKREK
jgi:hypothetical protein